MTQATDGAMTAGQQELDQHIQDALRRLAFRGLAAVAILAGTIVIWAVRLEGKSEQNQRRVEEVRAEGSIPLQDLKRDIAVLQEAMRNLTSELQRTQSAIRGNR